jgi:hypothetical protein
MASRALLGVLMAVEDWAWFWALMVMFTPVWIVACYAAVTGVWKWLHDKPFPQRVPAWKWLHHSTFGRWVVARWLRLHCLVCGRRAGYGGRCKVEDHNG